MRLNVGEVVSNRASSDCQAPFLNFVASLVEERPIPPDLSLVCETGSLARRHLSVENPAFRPLFAISLCENAISATTPSVTQSQEKPHLMIKPKREIQIARWTIAIPGTPTARKALGFALVVGGILGFLPILGFWMIPLGLMVLSIDLPSLRKYRRKWDVKLEKRRRLQEEGKSGDQDTSALDKSAMDQSPQ